MNCDETLELLPWLLNGTLGEDERRKAQEHLAACATCRASLPTTRQAWEIFDAHLPAADLVALAYGEAPGEVDPEIAQAHLAECPQCAAELELARISRRLEEDDRVALFPGTRSRTPGAAAPVPAAVPLRTSAASPASRKWRAAALAAGLTGLLAAGGWWHSAEQAHTLAGQLAAHPTASAVSPSPVPWPAPSATQSADAAHLAELEDKVQKLSGTVNELREREAELAKPKALPTPASERIAQLNTQVVDLFPSEGVVRGASAGTPGEMRSQTGATLVLSSATTTAEAAGAADYTVEIRDEQGAEVWHADGLRRDPAIHGYAFTLRPGELHPGAYKVQIYGVQDGRRQPAESYALVVR